MTDQQLEQAPAWLDLPEKQAYWTCYGRALSPKAKPPRKTTGCWGTIYYSKEDAEANASIPNGAWEDDDAGWSTEHYIEINATHYMEIPE